MRWDDDEFERCRFNTNKNRELAVVPWHEPYET